MRWEDWEVTSRSSVKLENYGEYNTLIIIDHHDMPDLCTYSDVGPGSRWRARTNRRWSKYDEGRRIKRESEFVMMDSEVVMEA